MKFSTSNWWGSKGCRFAGRPEHLCLDSFGRPVDGSHPCIAECRAAMADLFDQYRAVPA